MVDIFKYLSQKYVETFDCELYEENPCVQYARKLVVELKRSGIIPNEVVYDSLSSLFSKIGELTLAYQTLQDMQRLGFPCQPGAYRSLLLQTMRLKI